MGVLLGIYAATTLASYLLVGITDAAINKRLDREGYIDTTKKSTIEKVKEVMEMVIMLSVPVINFVLSCYAFFSDNIYQEVLSSGLADNTIRKKTDEELLIEREKSLLQNEKKKNEKQNENNEKNHIKSYSEMTTEEKLQFLEREKNFLLSQNNPQFNSSYNDRGAYSKKRN